MSSQPVKQQPAAIYEFGLPDRLRAARESAGFDQREFSEVTGISRGSISSYENAATTPRRPVLLAWATATGMDARWLETGEVPADGEDLDVRRQGLEPRTR